MAREEAVVAITLPAGGNMSTEQYRFVVVASDGQIDSVASAGGDADGVLLDKPSAAGDPARVAIAGVVPVVVGSGGVTRGDKLQSGADGEALTAASGDHVLGKALTTAAEGALVECLLVSKHILA